MADPLNPNQNQQPQVLEKKDYGYGVTTQNEWTKPNYQSQQPNQQQGQQPQQPAPLGQSNPQSQAGQPPVVQQPQAVQQYKAPVFRQSSGQDATSRLLNFAKANVGAGTQKMTQGVQQGLQNQTAQQQQKIQGLGAQDANKAFGYAQNAGTLANSFNTTGGFKNAIQGTLGTQSPQRAGLENFMLRSTPGAYSGIQNTAQQGLQDTLGTANQYLGGFNTRVMQNGNTLDNVKNYDNLTANQFAGPAKSEEDLAREQNLVKGEDGNWYNSSDFDYQYAPDEEMVDESGGPQAQGLMANLNKQNWLGRDAKAGLQAGAASVAKKTGMDIGAMTDTSNLANTAKTALTAPLTAMNAATESAKKLAGAKASAAMTKAEDQAKAIASNAASKAKSAVSNAAGGVGGFLKSFCHAAGTLVRMYDTSLKPIEDIVAGDKVMWGGEVLSIGCKLSSDTYLYYDTVVTGLHAVYEDAKWIRVKDSENAEYLGETHQVYPIITESHFVVTAGGIVWRDYEEVTDSEHLTDDQILDIMNSEVGDETDY